MPVSSLAPDDFAWLPATEQLASLDAKDVSSAELVELYKTGSAFLGPSVGTMAMVESILLDEKRLIPCAVLLKGEYGVNGTYCGTIVKLGAGGAEQVYEVPVTAEEKAKIVAAAKSTAELATLI